MSEYVFQEFPLWIYHLVEDSKIIQTKEELDHYLSKGWSKSPLQFTYIEELNAKIRYHKEEAFRLEDELKEFLEQEKIVVSPLENVEEAETPSKAEVEVQPSLTEETSVEPAPEGLQANVTARRRVGRPRKE